MDKNIDQVFADAEEKLLLQAGDLYDAFVEEVERCWDPYFRQNGEKYVSRKDSVLNTSIARFFVRNKYPSIVEQKDRALTQKIEEAVDTYLNAHIKNWSEKYCALLKEASRNMRQTLAQMCETSGMNAMVQDDSIRLSGAFPDAPEKRTEYLLRQGRLESTILDGMGFQHTYNATLPTQSVLQNLGKAIADPFVVWQDLKQPTIRDLANAKKAVLKDLKNEFGEAQERFRAQYSI